MPPLGSPSSAPICQHLSNFSVVMGCFLIPIEAHRLPIPLGDSYFPSDTLAIRRGALVFGHFRRGTNVKPEVDAWIAAQRLNRLAQWL